MDLADWSGLEARDKEWIKFSAKTLNPRGALEFLNTLAHVVLCKVQGQRGVSLWKALPSTSGLLRLPVSQVLGRLLAVARIQ